MRVEMVDVLIIGAGPAGLMAAEVLATANRQVLIVDAMPSAARKLLMAGKSGLNLTKDESLPQFADQYQPKDWLTPMLAAFGPEQVKAWANGLGQAVFTGSTGRVFPQAMKASPLARAWLARLARQGVGLRTRWRWTGLVDGAFEFDTPDGLAHVRPRVTVLALGGASWPRLGSNGQWTAILAPFGVEIAPFHPSNMGFVRVWSDHMTRHFGQPVKQVRLRAGAVEGRGEFVISARGVEGGGIYTLSSALYAGAPLVVDLLPNMSVEAIETKLAKRRKGDSLSNYLRKSLRLDAAKIALMQECARPLPDAPAALAGLIKSLPVALAGAYPMAQAISTTGGICRAAVGENLELAALPGVFAAGEMLDWDAPTGGYLMTGCLATGRWAGVAAGQFLDNTEGYHD